MKLCTTTREHLNEMMAWFPDQESCLNWGGPEFRFPFTEHTFLEDICWDRLPSYSLVSKNGGLMGFGQYYLREGRCHLGRLVVAPKFRGQGLGQVLVDLLVEVGCKDLGVNECSLFVLSHNEVASNCYRNAGFEPAAYPGDMPEVKGCLYMVKGSSDIDQKGASGDSPQRSRS